MLCRAEVSKDSITIKGLATHVYAKAVIDGLRDLLEVKGRGLRFFIEGSPKPLGEGLTIKVVVNGGLSDEELTAVKSYLKILGFTLK